MGYSNNWTLSTVLGVDPDLKLSPVHFSKSADNSDGESDIGSPLKMLDKGKGKGKAISSDSESEDNRPTSKIDKGKGKAISSDSESDNGEKSVRDENDLNHLKLPSLKKYTLKKLWLNLVSHLQLNNRLVNLLSKRLVIIREDLIFI